MIRKVDNIREVIRSVFGTDEDLYKNRQHGKDKTLDGLVNYTMKNLFEDNNIYEVIVYTYGDEYGFFAVNEENKYLVSFGIKKEHRDKKGLFWSSLKEILGSEFTAFIWAENDRAARFFDTMGEKVMETEGVLIYKFNLN